MPRPPVFGGPPRPPRPPEATGADLPPGPPLPPARPLWQRDTGAPQIPASPPTYEPQASSLANTLPRLPGYVRPEPAPRRLNQRVMVVLALASAVVAAVVTASLFLVFDDDPGGGTGTGQTAARLASDDPLDIAAILNKAQPSVVTIHTEERGASGVYGGAGTGVILSEDGYVVTNAHVISTAKALRVTLHDGREYEADVVGSFPEDDVALIQLSGSSDLVPAELGSSADVQVGDEVVAIGNALNLGASPSVTQGIVSALDRSIEAPTGVLQNLIQTDAAINRGNSGGPLLNPAGQVIGLNTAIAADAQNIGFAIPIDHIKPLIEDLKDGLGTPPAAGGFLGVRTVAVAEVPTEVRDQFGVSASRGAFVDEVLPDTAAADAGLQQGDVIVAVDGAPVEDSQDLGALLRSKAPGDTVTISYERAGRKAHLDITLGEG